MFAASPSRDDAADIVAIQQVAAAYGEAMSRGRPDLAAEVFTIDGVITNPNGDYVGPVAIAGMLAASLAEVDLLVQTTQLGSVSVVGDRAHGRFPWTVWQHRHDGDGIHLMGVYDDEFKRTADGWRMAHRVIRPLVQGRPDHLGGRVVALPDADFGPA
jgi:ketosteroid isomerase-like protein